MLSADDLKIRVYKENAPLPKIFSLIQKWGNVDEIEMYSTFNMGIGFTICVDTGDADAVIETIRNTGEHAYNIGIVEKRTEGEKDIVIV
jgi:phosphoribosylformylglycinamidine cyclo-ligase